MENRVGRVIIATDNNDKMTGVRSIFPDSEIIKIKSRSNIGDGLAFDSALFIAVYNRIKNIVNSDVEVNANDIIIAIQSGFCQNGDKYYATDVCAVYNENEGLRIGNGPMFEISRMVYDTANKGIYLHEFISDITKSNSTTSMLHFISEGVLNRAYVSQLALCEALQSKPVAIGEAKLDFSSTIKFQNDNTKLLEEKCFEKYRNEQLGK